MTDGNRAPSRSQDTEKLLGNLFAYANLASRQSHGAVGDLIEQIDYERDKFAIATVGEEHPLVAELELVLRNLQQGDALARDWHLFQQAVSGSDGNRFNDLFKHLLLGVRAFDRTYPGVRHSLEEHLGEAFLGQVFGHCGAARINMGRALFTLNEICVKIFGLKDRENDIPPVKQAAEDVGLLPSEVSGGDRVARHAGSASSGYEDLDLAVSDGELLRHPEVRQVRILEEIAKTTVALASIEARRSELVSEARGLSISWARIGAAAQITSQGALRKWDSGAREKHRGYADKLGDEKSARSSDG